MTQEEAVEVILGERAWLSCLVCEGRGRTDDVAVSGVVTHMCGVCLGVGSTRNQVYIDARHILQLTHPYPERPLTRKERIAEMTGNIIKTALGTSTSDRLKRLFNIREDE